MARSIKPLHLDRVSFSYDGQASPAVSELSLSLGRGWTCLAGPNGSGKTTFALLACGLLEPESGRIEAPSSAFYCAQRVDKPPEGAALLRLARGEAAELASRLGLESDWADRWESLSLGECKRLQAWTALVSDPELLVLDEPTNHLDGEAKGFLLEALASFRGIGILISHDRDFADRLCERCLLAPSWRLLDFPLTKSLEIVESEAEAARGARAEAIAELHRLTRTAQAAREAEDRSRGLGSKRDLDSRDHDGKARIDAARLRGKDARAGRASRRLEDRVARAQAGLGRLPAEGERKEGVSIACSPSRRDLLAALGPGSIALGPTRRLELPELRVGPRDRIGLVGPNGSGKSSLLRELVADARGRGVAPAYLPQDLGEAEGAAAIERMRALGRDELGRLMSELYRLGSEPEAVLASAFPSPGELRKALVAEAFAGGMPMIVADEATNHLDIEALRCLEEALRDYRGALLIASHDMRFIEATCSTLWRIEGGRLALDPSVLPP